MNRDNAQATIVKKEMGITHKEFYAELPQLLNDLPYHHNKDTIKFQINHKNVEIILGPEEFRQLSQTMRLPVTFVTLRFFDFSEEEIRSFIKHFNLRFMKGGG